MLSQALKLEKSFLCEFLYEICEFEASGMKVHEVSLQGGNAQLPSSLIMLICCSIIDVQK